jgi:serine/threonine protein kinase
MRYKLIKGTCKGLRYLHKDRGKGPIVHLNLCPSNVLLDEKNAACVTGFDFSKLIGEKENRSIAVKKDGQMYVYYQCRPFGIQRYLCVAADRSSYYSMDR